MSDPYLYEFLYRGHPAGGGAPAWHVIVGQKVQIPGQADPQFVSSGALTPDQAAAAGFSLDAVIAGINAAAMADRDAQAEALAEAQKQISTLTADLNTAQEQLAGVTKNRDELSDSVAALKRQIAEMVAAQPTA